MSRDERRQALVDATLPLLVEHGRTVTTRQIAAAAGVAEGTIFRAFDSKHDLVQATLENAFEFAPFLADLRAIDPDQPLPDLVTDIVTTLQDRFRGIFVLMTALGLVGPPKARRHSSDERREAAEIMEGLVAPHAAELACPVDHFVHVTRLLTFAGSHPHLSDGRLLSPEEIVTTVLDGLRKET